MIKPATTMKTSFLSSSGYTDFRNHLQSTWNEGFHKAVIRDNFSLIVTQLQISPVFYRLLREKGILSDQQIRIIQREGSQEYKVAKLLSLLEAEGWWVLEPFSEVLKETGYVELAKALNNAALTRSLEKRDNGGKRDKLWKQVQTLEQELQKGYMEEALTLKRALGDMKREYLLRLQDLENELAFMERERDVARKEQKMALLKKESLLKENKELLKILRHLRQSLEHHESKWNGAAPTHQTLLYNNPIRQKWN
ncbi:uncharacterized protein [Hemitrygon akajei]|uniref:uncharacterized protein n=1 Tax=Hemitrygon akajei TaxID=2704970 RepID=UPI003BF9557A